MCRWIHSHALQTKSVGFKSSSSLSTLASSQLCRVTMRDVGPDSDWNGELFFFLEWSPQAVLFLSHNEGGEGLVCLASGAAICWRWRDPSWAASRPWALCWAFASPAEFRGAWSSGRKSFFSWGGPEERFGADGRPPASRWPTPETWASVPPRCRILYKPLLRKKTGALQWRILHGDTATNSFICAVFRTFGVKFKALASIVVSNAIGKTKCQVFMFFEWWSQIGDLLDPQNRVQSGTASELAFLWRQSIQSRIRMEFWFYKETKDLEAFEQLWGVDECLPSNWARWARFYKLPDVDFFPWSVF